MNIQKYIADQLASGRTMEDIMKDITASANAAEKEYEALKVKVKDYTRPLNLDNEVLTAIHKNEISAETVADIFMYWLGKNTSDFILTLSDKELDVMRSEFVSELKNAETSLTRFVKIISDDTKNDFDKFYALTADLLDMKLSKPKAKIKTDAEKIADSMRKLGF